MGTKGALAFFLLFLGSLACPLRAQESALLRGLITDASGAPLAGAAVSVRNSDTGAVRKTVSDTGGHYNIPLLGVGSYVLTISKPGFQTASKTGITLVVGEQLEEDLALPIGELKQVITVEEKPTVVELSTEQTSGLVTERQVKDLPLNGRSYDELMSLNPGIVNYSAERSGGVGTSNSAIGNMFSASGRRPQESLFLLNGVEYTGASEINLTPGGTSGQLLGVDAVREFNVVTDAYGAEYGKRPGAQVSVVSTSGTNQQHGSLYEFLRNSSLDARNFFDQGSIAPFERNEFGGALGGPLEKDKTFLFGNYEGFRQRLGLSDVTLVPNAAARATAVPSVQPLLSLWPKANGVDFGGGIAQAFNQPLQRIREDFGTTRVDHTFSSRDTLFGAFTIDDSFDNTPTVNPITSIVEGLREQVISLQETHVFSATITNTSRFGFSRGSLDFNSAVANNVPGWVAGKPIGAIVIGGGTASNAATQISQAGANVASNTNSARNLFTYEDQVDLNFGAHHLQAGAWVQRIQANDNFAQGQYGQASFSSLSSFLTGNVSAFTAVPSPTPLGWRSVEAAEFIQDTFKVTPHLELKVGLRIESTNGWNEAHGRASNYLFGPGGVIQTQPRVGNSVFTQNRAKFLPQPRFGLAWDPFGKGNTVVHAGFGLYNALLDNLSYRLDQNAPYNTTLSVKNVPVSSLQFVPGAPLPVGGLISPGGVQPDMYTPTIESYTLKIEQKLSSSTALSVGYVGSHGYHETLSVDANEPFPSLLGGMAYYPKGAPLANPQLANTTSWFSEGISLYNALQVDVNRRFQNGLQLRGVYTFSKSMDDGGTLNTSVGTNTPAFTMFPLKPKLDYGRSPFDARHLAVINGTYELPVGKGKSILGSATGLINGVLSGWSLGGVATLQSGFPFTPQLGYNPTNNGDSRNPIRPSWNPAFTGQLVPGGPTQFFNPSAFVTPANGTYGNVGRDVLPGPGLATVDLSLLKTTPIRERMSLQFRAECFNLLNHTNFNTPNPVVYTAAGSSPSPTAGVISSTATSSRQLQFGLKLLF